jgi:transposase-like protein
MIEQRLIGLVQYVGRIRISSAHRRDLTRSHPVVIGRSTILSVPAPHRDEDRKRAVELYLQHERTVDEIAQELSTSRSTIYSWLAMAGVTGNRTRLGLPVESAELRDQIAEVLANQLRFMDDIDKMTEALNALRSEQESNRGGWMGAINEARHDIEGATRALDGINATLNRLLGAVETLVTVCSPTQTRSGSETRSD